MTRTELIIQLLKVAIGLAFGAYFVWWSLEVLDRLAPEDEVPAAVTKHGYEPTRGAAMAAFAKSRRREIGPHGCWRGRRSKHPEAPEDRRPSLVEKRGGTDGDG